MLIYSWCVLFNAAILAIFARSKPGKELLEGGAPAAVSLLIVALSGPLFALFVAWRFVYDMGGALLHMIHMAWLLAENKYLRWRLGRSTWDKYVKKEKRLRAPIIKAVEALPDGAEHKSEMLAVLRERMDLP